MPTVSSRIGFSVHFERHHTILHKISFIGMNSSEMIVTFTARE